METSYSSAEQNTFCICCLLIKLQNIIINRIHFCALRAGHISKGVGDGLTIGSIFCLQLDEPITGGVPISGELYKLQFYGNQVGVVAFNCECNALSVLVRSQV